MTEAPQIDDGPLPATEETKCYTVGGDHIAGRLLELPRPGQRGTLLETRAGGKTTRLPRWTSLSTEMEFPLKLENISTRNEAFTLAELILVVAIIALFTAMAIPNILAPRVVSNAASCRSSLRTVSNVNETYRKRFQRYATTLRDLEREGHIDSVLGGGTKSGYDFAYTGGEDGWSCQADPSVPGTTGDRYFFCDQSGVIRFSTTGPASSADPKFEFRRRNRDYPLVRLTIALSIAVIIADLAFIILRERRKSARQAARAPTSA